MRDEVILEDTTLRDGEQAAGLVFDSATKLKIFNLLQLAGVKWVEVGIPAMGGHELRSIEMIQERAGSTNVVAWNRGVKEDVKQSLDLGFKAIHIGLPTSEKHLKHSINKDKAWLLKTSRDLVQYAKDRNAFVSISAEDIGRSEMSFVIDYGGVVCDAGADRLRLSDTIGILTPEKYHKIVKVINAAVSIDLQCHAHNDFGLAVANTLAGLQAGARYFHATVNAIGERAGMPDMAQCVLALKCLYGKEIGIRLNQLPKISELVEEATRQPLPPWQPVVGTNIFAHESGIHGKATISDSTTFEPFPPDLVGGTRRLVIGKHSGRAILEYHLREAEIEPDTSRLSECLTKVREAAHLKKRSLNSSDLIEIYQQI